ncbi:MAG TPA: type II toxin-antitoxin system prevent-host-death family antitoxin [Rubrivivax sp.]|nr:type II toxin-antitoxin system prevent-host-death family antitoxin [Rubrivivax sp.]
MKTVTAAEANRHFSSLLKDVARGERFLVTSRGKPVATIAPPERPVEDKDRELARQQWLATLSSVEPLGPITWTRDELYER